MGQESSLVSQTGQGRRNRFASNFKSMKDDDDTCVDNGGLAF